MTTFCMRVLTGAVIALALAGCARQGARPMSQMQGDCDNYQLDLKREFVLAQGEATKLVAAAQTGAEVPAVVVDTKLSVALRPEAEVRYVVQPQRRGGQANRYGGVLSLEVPRSGLHRISTSMAVWVEIVSSAGERLKPSKFEMQSNCKTVFKSVLYDLRADQRYHFQLSANSEANVAIYVVPQ